MSDLSMQDFVEWAEQRTPARSPRSSSRPRRRRRLLAMVVALALLAAPMSVAVAAHLFPDVPTTHPHHTGISRIALAGITAGCGGSANYCPEDPVTRDQMGTFLSRGLGRVAFDSTAPASVAPSTDVTVANLTLTPGYASNKIAGANGFLKIDGNVTINEAAADGCECYVRIEIHVDGVDVPGVQYVWLDNDAGNQLASASITASVPVSANGARTVELVVNEYIGSETLSAWATLTALYVPFGSSGTDVLSVSSVDSPAAEEPGQ